MREAPFHSKGKGALQHQQQAFFSSPNEGFLEPRSVLDHRSPSPSPPTSSSTLSSSLGGGGVGSETAGVAAVSDKNPTPKWPLSGPSASAAGGGGGTAELETVPTGLEVGFGGGGEVGAEGWEAVLSEPSAASPGQEQTFLGWLMGDPGDLSAVGGGGGAFHNVGLGFGLIDAPSLDLGSIGPLSSDSTITPSLALEMSSGDCLSPPPLRPPEMVYHELVDDEPGLFGLPSLLSQQQLPHAAPNPAFFAPFPSYAASHAELQALLPPPPPPLLLPPHAKRHHPMAGNPTCQIAPKPPTLDAPGGGMDPFLCRNQFQPLPLPPLPVQHPLDMPQLPIQSRPESRSVPKPKATVGEEAALVEQLLTAAKAVEDGNFASVHQILARLNQQLPSPAGKPLLRSAFYLKQALHLLLANSSASSSPSHPPSPFSAPVASPMDVVLKLGAYKAFSEVSPILHFTNFSCVQALLEELGGADRIHIIDFDIGVGGQWSSFIQELAQRRCPTAGTTPMLKITAFISPNSYHHLELCLIHDNLSHFANGLNIPFEFNVLCLDNFDPSELLAVGGESIAVSLPVSSGHIPSFPTLLRLVKQLCPKIVVTVDHGCDRSNLSFAPHFFHTFQSSMVMLDSIDAVGTHFDVANKIERFLLQPRVESSVLGRHRAAENKPPWRTLFASAGFVPVQFSNFTETQAECLLKRAQVRGFHVEKHQSSLNLYWQRGELISVSAWRC